MNALKFRLMSLFFKLSVSVKNGPLFWFLFLTIIGTCFSQSNPVMNIFPETTVLHGNIPYKDNALPKQLLDLYKPGNSKSKIPLVIFIHGGAWLSNDKYADMGYMKKTVAEIVSSGFALASIDYRFSTEEVFPAQIQDINCAISFLYDHAENYGLDKDRFALIGFSAGGHLASLAGLSKNNEVEAFFMPNTNKSFSIKAVVDFYGPAELILFPGAEDNQSPEALLIGATPLDRPDLSRYASPVTYVDENDPPFLLVHGENDEQVDPKQSRLLSAWLNVKGVPNELIIVEGAPHYGEMFDTEKVRKRVIAFLQRYLE